MVRTEGPDGALHDYAIAYTFGVYPLQQYLIAFPGGRYQALGIAWDSGRRNRAANAGSTSTRTRSSAGGPAALDRPRPDLELSVRRLPLDRSQKELRSGQPTPMRPPGPTSTSPARPATARARAMSHWAKTLEYGASRKSGHSDEGPDGPEAWLEGNQPGQWDMNPDDRHCPAHRAARFGQLDACAPCHSRRKVLAKDGSGWRAVPRCCSAGVCWSQAFITPMDRSTARCSNTARSFRAECIAPASSAPIATIRIAAKLRAQGNALCAQCHMPAKFDVAAHHKHPPGSTGAQCVNCHMPTKTYMVVHDRRDHSFRVPRPDLSVSIGTPNACNQCHTDRTAEWAAKAVAAWYPNGRQTRPHYGTALQCRPDRRRRCGAPTGSTNPGQSQPAIARASGLLLLARYASCGLRAAIKAAIADPDPLVRMAVPRALSASRRGPR